MDQLLEIHGNSFNVVAYGRYALSFDLPLSIFSAGRAGQVPYSAAADDSLLVRAAVTVK